MNESILSQCAGLSQCTPTIMFDDIWNPVTYRVPPPDVIFFAQVSCEALESDLVLKRNLALVCSCIGLFMCIYFRFTMLHIDSRINLDEKLFDYELISIEDYSVRGRISKALYD